jgi:RhtX/FptX family siderophore transporter
MKKLGLLATLYISQGLPYGFFTQALPVLMRKEGWSLGAIGLSSLLALPWALKFLWAPLVDRLYWPGFGRRRSWIVPLQALTALVLLGLAVLTPSSVIGVLLGAVLVVNLLAATQDVATDGLAVELLPPEARGLANGVQVAGYRLGMIVGGGALLMVYDDIGWRGVFAAMGTLIVALTVPVLWMREPALVSPGPSATASATSAPLPPHFLRRRGVGAVLLLTVVWKLGESFGTGMLRPYLADLGLSLGDVGALLGTVGFVSGLVGALLGGALVGPLGRRRALVGFGVLQAGAVLLYALLAQGTLPPEALPAVVAAEHVASGMATAALFTCMMDWCDPRSAGTDYTVQASAVVIAQGGAAALSGYSAELLGYAGHFLLASGLAALAVLPAVWRFPQRPEA